MTGKRQDPISFDPGVRNPGVAQRSYCRLFKSIGSSLLTLSLVGGVFGLASAACAQQKALPPEVKSMIGMKVPPKVPGKQPGQTPNFKERSGELIGMSNDPQDPMHAVIEGVVAGKWPVFYIQRIYPDKTLEILDMQLLPAELMEWRFDNGAFRYMNGRFRLSKNCRIGDEDPRRIFGLVKPEVGKTDCAHFSSRVNKAWEIKAPSGQIVPISTDSDLQCEYVTMNTCY